MKLHSHAALLSLLLALLLGLTIDLLFRQELLGFNFVAFTFLWVGTCAGAALAAKKTLQPQSALYAAIALTNSIIVYFRDSPLVQFWSIIITLTALLLLVGSCAFDNFTAMPLINRWRETVKQYILNAINAPRVYLGAIRHKQATRILRISRGALVAAALALVFIMLFVSADAVVGHMFSWVGDGLTHIINFFERFDIGRIISILFWTFAAASAILFVYHAHTGETKPLLTIRAQLTRKDSLIIFVTLLTIFSVFVTVQLYYLFSAGKLPDGLTYAQYARQGYVQLLFATLLASAAIKGVISATHGGAVDKTLRTMAAALVILNSIIVISAWKRLSLYETAYGWTRARFVAHLGLICVALGSIALLVWLYGKCNTKQLYASSWYIVLFVLMTAAVLNPDAVIVRKNISERASRIVVLDTYYLRNLSRDSWPSICTQANRLAETYPLEYAVLAQHPNQTQGTASRRLSRHYTHSKSFVDNNTACL